MFSQENRHNGPYWKMLFAGAIGIIVYWFNNSAFFNSQSMDENAEFVPLKL